MKILIATPVYQDMCHARMAQGVGQFQRMLDGRGVRSQWMTVSSTYIQVGRDTLAHRFLCGDYTHLFFIDSDIFFDPEKALKLLTYGDLDVVTGLYPSKEVYWKGIKQLAPHCSTHKLQHMHAMNMVYRVPEDKHRMITKADEPVEVTGAATGFMLVKRETFEDFKAKNPCENYDWGQEGNIVRFFKVGFLPDDPSKLYYGEDMWFCAMVRRLGKKIWVVPSLTVSHMGQHIYEGCYFCTCGIGLHKFDDDDEKVPEVSGDKAS